MIPKFKEPIVYVDVDDTLVSWKPVPFRLADRIESLQVNLEVLDHIRRHKLCGHTVIVWSAGGADWAEKVVKYLEIEDIVDAVMSKPNWYVDDKPASMFMPEHIWNDPETIKGEK
jgi:hypothetical protein